MGKRLSSNGGKLGLVDAGCRRVTARLAVSLLGELRV